MSIPKFPAVDPPLSFEEAINMILASIAMEEASLSHIIQAEEEKLRYVLGTLPQNGGENGGDGENEISDNVPIEDILAVNKSVKALLDTVTYNQMLLKGKMNDALEALEEHEHPTGTTGATGATKPCAYAQLILPKH